MSKERSGASGLIKPVVSLLLICLIAAGVLAGANAVTEEPIAQRAEADAVAAKQAALSEAVSFSDEKQTSDEKVTCFEGFDASGGLVGYVFSCEVNSYGGKLTLMAGFGLDGAVTGVTITEINDTPGLGLKAKTDPAFLPQFTGLTGNAGVVKNAADKGENDVVAITSATITSKAVASAVNAARAQFDALKGGEADG
ncbi:MAG: FMN-binding protein [Clostridia bacterium]|nr:FMN-binding protein [Clostridia bacterium]